MSGAVVVIGASIEKLLQALEDHRCVVVPAVQNSAPVSTNFI